MATKTIEPPAAIEPIDNPVIKDDFQDASAVFRQARVDVGLDAPPEPKSEPEPTPAAEPEPSAEPAPTGVLPDDILEPTPPEPTKPSDTIAEIQAMQLPKGAKEKTVSGFHELKEKSIKAISDLESRMAELQTQLQKSGSKDETAALQKKYEEAAKRASDIEEQWARASFETSPRFQARYGAAEKNSLESAKAYLEGTEIDPRIIDIAAQMQGKKRLDLLSEAGADDKLIAAVTSHLANYDLIQKDKQTALENWRSEGQRWQEEDAARAEAEAAQRKTNEDRVWGSVLVRNSTLLPFRSSKNEQWNSRAKDLQTRAKDIYNGDGADMETMADIVQKGVAYDAVEEINQQLVEKVKNLTAENATLKSARPGGVITTTNGSVPGSDDSKLSDEERAKKTFNDMLAKARGA